jgi:MraZ protein
MVVKPLLVQTFRGIKWWGKNKIRKIWWLSGKKCYFVSLILKRCKPLIMTGFLGEFESTLDAKGRFLLPGGFKKQLAEGESLKFVINRGFEKCLSLYPVKNWEPLYNEINNLSDFDPKAREFKRFFLNGATIVEPDSAGRILVPPNLKQHAELEKDLVLMATGNKLEIWDSKNYKKFFDSYSPETFSNLAKDVMVKDKDKE